MIVINNKKYLDKVKMIYDKGTNRYLMQENKIKYYSWVEIGSAFLMTEFSASFLNPQIQNYKEIILKGQKFITDTCIYFHKLIKIFLHSK